MGCQGELARRRRQGLRDALTSAGRLAMEQGCLAVTIGGDLYEHERAGVDTGRFLADTFASWQPMRVLIAPGNHDALLPGSLYRRVEWPSNVTVFSEHRVRARGARRRAHGLGPRSSRARLAGRSARRPHRPRPDPASISPFSTAPSSARDPRASRSTGRSTPSGSAPPALPPRSAATITAGASIPPTGPPLPRDARSHSSFDDEGGRGPVVVEVERSGRCPVHRPRHQSMVGVHRAVRRRRVRIRGGGDRRGHDALRIDRIRRPGADHDPRRSQRLDRPIGVAGRVHPRACGARTPQPRRRQGARSHCAVHRSRHRAASRRARAARSCGRRPPQRRMRTPTRPRCSRTRCATG